MTPENTQEFLVRVTTHHAAHKGVYFENPSVPLARVDVAAAEHDQIEVVRTRKFPRAVGGLVERELRIWCYCAYGALITAANRQY